MNRQPLKGKLQEIQDEEISEDDDDMGLFNINTISSKAPPIEVSLTVNGEPIKMTVDTGAAVSIIFEKVIKTFKEVELKPTDAVLMTYTAERITVLGCADVDIQYGSQRKKLQVYVVQGNRSCLLGRDWLRYFQVNFIFTNQ